MPGAGTFALSGPQQQGGHATAAVAQPGIRSKRLVIRLTGKVKAA